MTRSPLAAALGRLLKEQREAVGLSQDEVAYAARWAGLGDWTRAVVAALETGRRRLDAEELVRLPDLFNSITPEDPEDWTLERLLAAAKVPRGSRPRGSVDDAIAEGKRRETAEYVAEMFKVDPKTVERWSRAAWRRDLADERDRRARERGVEGDRVALGHVTRELIEELRERRKP